MTGVQTCALPISGKGNHRATTGRDFFDADATLTWNTIEDPSQPAGSKATDETATKKKTREDDPVSFLSRLASVLNHHR